MRKLQSQTSEKLRCLALTVMVFRLQKQHICVDYHLGFQARHLADDPLPTPAWALGVSLWFYFVMCQTLTGFHTGERTETKSHFHTDIFYAKQSF